MLPPEDLISEAIRDLADSTTLLHEIEMRLGSDQERPNDLIHAQKTAHHINNLLTQLSLLSDLYPDKMKSDEPFKLKQAARNALRKLLLQKQKHPQQPQTIQIFDDPINIIRDRPADEQEKWIERLSFTELKGILYRYDLFPEG